MSLMHSTGNIFLLKQKESHLDPPARLDVLACFGFLIIVIEGNDLHMVNPRRGMGATPPNAFLTHVAP